MNALFRYNTYPMLRHALQNRQPELEQLFRICTPEQMTTLEGFAENNPEFLEMALKAIWKDLPEKSQE